jgi:hypothetical protein
MVDGQIKAACAPGNGDAVPQTREKIIFTHELIDLGAQAVQIFKSAVDAGKHIFQDWLVHTGVGAKRHQMQSMAIQVFEHVGLEIGATPHLDDFKKCREAKMVVQRLVSPNEFLKAIKQML